MLCFVGNEMISLVRPRVPFLHSVLMWARDFAVISIFHVFPYDWVLYFTIRYEQVNFDLFFHIFSISHSLFFIVMNVVGKKMVKWA